MGFQNCFVYLSSRIKTNNCTFEHGLAHYGSIRRVPVGKAALMLPLKAGLTFLY